MISRKVGPGQYVRIDAPDPLFVIADLSSMWLKAYVPENDAPAIRVGQDVDVRVMALPEGVFKARVVFVGASSDPVTHRVMVRSEVTNPDGDPQGRHVRQLPDRHRYSDFAHQVCRSNP